MTGSMRCHPCSKTSVVIRSTSEMFRICHPADFEGFYFYDSKLGKFGGAFSQVFNEPFEVIHQGMAALMSNLSIIIEPSASLNIAGRNSQNFQGCITALQRNRSDLLYAMAEYPSRHTNVSQGLTVFDTILTIGSMYQKDVTGEVAQVLDSFASFSLTVWLMCLVTVFSLSLLLRMRNALAPEKDNNYSFMSTVTHMARLNSMSALHVTRKVIFLCASLHSLVVVHYFCSLIKTELVTTRDPVVFRSYQDIIDRRVVPVFVEEMSFDAFFSSEDAPPFRRSLWKYANTHFRLDDLYVKSNPVQFLITALNILLEKNVIISDDLIMPTIPASGCSMAARDPDKFVAACNKMSTISFGSLKVDQYVIEHFERLNPNFHLDRMPGFNFFTAVDPNEKSYTLGILTSEQMTPDMSDGFKKTLRRVTQAGLHLQIAGRLKGFNSISNLEGLSEIFGPVNESRVHLAQECESCTIIKPDSHFQPLKVQNFKTLLTLVLALVPILFLVLMAENYE